MSIPRFSTKISARKCLKQEKKEDSKKSINAETFGQITNQTENYSERENNFSGKIIQTETFGGITNNTNYNCESGKIAMCLELETCQVASGQYSGPKIKTIPDNSGGGTRLPPATPHHPQHRRGQLKHPKSKNYSNLGSLINLRYISLSIRATFRSP